MTSSAKTPLTRTLTLTSIDWARVLTLRLLLFWSSTAKISFSFVKLGVISAWRAIRSPTTLKFVAVTITATAMKFFFIFVAARSIPTVAIAWISWAGAHAVASTIWSTSTTRRSSVWTRIVVVAVSTIRATWHRKALHRSHPGPLNCAQLLINFLLFLTQLLNFLQTETKESKLVQN